MFVLKEYVYFARPDSDIDGINVSKARERMGERLADKIKETLGEEMLKDIDVVIPIPETANVSSATVAERLKKPHCMGFVKNRYVFRTFIMPGQGVRQKSVRRKLSTMDSEFTGKCVLLVDDSIVRGTTSREIVSMAREAGARKVIFASCAPPITHPHIYGIDLASPSELIAHERDRFDIAKHMGAEAVIYQDLGDLKACCAELSPRDPKTQTFEVGVFCGEYITTVPPGYFEHLDKLRGSNKRKAAAVDGVEATQVASSGPTLEVHGPDVTAPQQQQPAQKKSNGSLESRPLQYRSPPRSPADREDIRYAGPSTLSCSSFLKTSTN